MLLNNELLAPVLIGLQALFIQKKAVFRHFSEDLTDLATPSALPWPIEQIAPQRLAQPAGNTFPSAVKKAAFTV